MQEKINKYRKEIQEAQMLEMNKDHLDQPFNARKEEIVQTQNGCPAEEKIAQQSQVKVEYEEQLSRKRKENEVFVGDNGPTLLELGGFKRDGGEVKREDSYKFRYKLRFC